MCCAVQLEGSQRISLSVRQLLLTSASQWIRVSSLIYLRDLVLKEEGAQAPASQGLEFKYLPLQLLFTAVRCRMMSGDLIPESFTLHVLVVALSTGSVTTTRQHRGHSSGMACIAPRRASYEAFGGRNRRRCIALQPALPSILSLQTECHAYVEGLSAVQEIILRSHGVQSTC